MGGESCWRGLLWPGATTRQSLLDPLGVQLPQRMGGDPLGGSSGVRSRQGPWHFTVEMECTEHMELER